MKKAFFLLTFVLPISGMAADTIHPSCRVAYEEARAGKLDLAVTSLAQCGASTNKPTHQHTLALLDRARFLDQLGRQDEAEKQLLALTEPAHFETGLADVFSGPGAWSRDPDKTRARQATGLNRADLLLEISRRRLQAKDYPAAINWAERSAQHALTRFQPEGEFFPMDRDVGCALAMRGFARAEIDSLQRAAWSDILRGYIRGCQKLPLADNLAQQPEAARQKINALKQQFEHVQVEEKRVAEAIQTERSERAAKRTSSGSSDSFLLAMDMLADNTSRKKLAEPVLKLRDEFLAAEADTLGQEALFDQPKNHD